MSWPIGIWRGAGVALALLMSAPAAAVDLSGELALVSDYRYRGVSLSNGKPAVQGSLLVEHGSGLYAELWGSTLGSPRGPTDAEIDLTAGYELGLTEAVTLDLSGTYYLYPKAGGDNYIEATAIATMERGPASAMLGVSFVPPQRATRDENGRSTGSGYAFIGASYAVPGTPLTASARVGHERGYFDEVDGGGKWDWSIGADVEFRSAHFGLHYTGSNATSDRRGLVASLSVGW